MTPARQVATDHTMSFIEPLLTGGVKSILEVGCGNGDLAVALQQKGHQITGLDSSEEAIETAKQAGLKAAICKGFLDFTSSPDRLFDHLLFTRSIHHIQPLSWVLKKAKSLLKQGGLIVIEDFSYETMDQSTMNWAAALWNFLQMRETLTDESKDFYLEGPALEQWHLHYHKEHAITSGAEITKLVSENFKVESKEVCPYLYRYFLKAVGEKIPQEEVQKILDLEVEAISTSRITAVGLRLVARHEALPS